MLIGIYFIRYSRLCFLYCLCTVIACDAVNEIRLIACTVVCECKCYHSEIKRCYGRFELSYTCLYSRAGRPCAAERFNVFGCTHIACRPAYFKVEVLTDTEPSCYLSKIINAHLTSHIIEIDITRISQCGSYRNIADKAHYTTRLIVVVICVDTAAVNLRVLVGNTRNKCGGRRYCLEG